MGFPSLELCRDVCECKHGGVHVLLNRVRAQESVELAFQLHTVETMWPLAREDVVLSNEWSHAPFDLSGDPEAGAKKRGLDPLQVPSRATMMSRLLKRTRAPGTKSPMW